MCVFWGLFFEDCVGEDFLYVVQVFQDVEQFLYFDCVFVGEFDFGLWFYDDFGQFCFEVCGFQCGFDFGEIVGWVDDFE